MVDFDFDFVPFCWWFVGSRLCDLWGRVDRWMIRRFGGDENCLHIDSSVLLRSRLVVT